jgi:hypothetical protein
MDTFSTYYIKKYNTLAEELKRLQYENKLLEDITSSMIPSRPDQLSVSQGAPGGSSISTSSGSGTNPPKPPVFNPDINNDNVVDGADLGAFLANWNNPYGGAELGNLLAHWGQNPSNPSEPEDPDDPEDPEDPGQPSNPTNPQDPRGFYPGDNVRGTSTKDIATLRRSIIF